MLGVAGDRWEVVALIAAESEMIRIMPRQLAKKLL